MIQNDNETFNEEPNNDSLEISKIVQQQEKLGETIDGEIEIDDLLYQLQEGEILNLQKQLNKLYVLIEEDKEILDYFSSRILTGLNLSLKKYKKDNDLFELQQNFEAFFHELKIRNKEKQQNLIQLRNNFISKQNISKMLENLVSKMNKEVKLFKHLNEMKTKRHGGGMKKNISSTSDKDVKDVYDWIIDIDLITNINKDGWKINFSQHFLENSSTTVKRNIIGDPSLEQNETQNSFTQDNIQLGDQNNKFGWEGAIVAVVGLYDKGKTFVLNNLSQCKLPSGKKVNTKGLSFKYVNIESGTKLILLDTAGSYSPVKVVNNFSIIEKEATEMFILELVFEISDYFIFVVNDFTSLDQRYLDKLTRSLHNSPNKNFREVIVIHNFKEVESEEILNHIWNNQVMEIYQIGSIQKTVVAAVNPLTQKLEEKQVTWFKSKYTRHVCLVNQDSVLGLNINPWTFSLLKYWLKAVFIPINRQFSVVDSVINSASHKLSSYFKANVDIIMNETDDKLVKIIKNKNNLKEGLRMFQIAVDSSGFVMTRPDSFLPNCDVIKGEEYVIILDLPGLAEEDVKVCRQNVYTIIKGCRRKTSQELGAKDGEYEKNERKFGEFTIRFKIPEEYERKWSSFLMENGVLTLKYKKDLEDNDIVLDQNSYHDTQLNQLIQQLINVFQNLQSIYLTHRQNFYQMFFQRVKIQTLIFLIDFIFFQFFSSI